eukprot:COSAG02_NODE_64109_length_261_cov_0.932099_1_plen_86_part_11
MAIREPGVASAKVSTSLAPVWVPSRSVARAIHLAQLGTDDNPVAQRSSPAWWPAAVCPRDLEEQRLLQLMIDPAAPLLPAPALQHH